ncbi:MAG TPA: glycoside hydrolase family 99-like domain-containing protein [Anaerolineaceae bacterium]|nr:glycoside hydrolase family 99-like domain-containing protein [Anaerolineaceae bacterium]
MRKLLVDYLVIKRSGLFDSGYYLQEYGDIRRADVDPLLHFVRCGWKEGRNPSKHFNTRYYLENNPDVRNANVNPLCHYITHGRKEGRSPYPGAAFIMRQNLESTQTEYVEYIDISDTYIDQVPVNLIAFYLPQFHPIPENDLWWGKGFTEWTNVSKATPQFDGHYQPHLPGELGFYDLRILEIQKRQVELAKQYGIYGFCFYYYWFNGKRLLEKPMDQFINDPELDFPFCICWANENWSRRWDGGEHEILIAQEHSYEFDKRIIHDFIELFANPRYIRVQGRPLLIVYRVDIMTDVRRTLDYWREVSINAGMGDPYILAAQTFGYIDPRKDGFDGAVEFPPHNGAEIPEITDSLKKLNPYYSGRVLRYADFSEQSMLRIVPQPFRRFNTVFPSWDNSPRRQGAGLTYYGSTPALYARWLKRACVFALENFPPGERFVFINAWNEWGEGAHLEPDRKFGYAYLQATQDVLRDLNNPSSTPLPSVLEDRPVADLSNPIWSYYNKIIKQIPCSFTVSEPQELECQSAQLAESIDTLLAPVVALNGSVPDATILIPVYNHFEDTLNCIKSIACAKDKYRIQLLIVDDGSSDLTGSVFSRCKNLCYLRNQENLGFLQSVNQGSEHASGKYLLLLNNDTIVLPGWLDEMIDTFATDPQVGLVGSKLLYPDGRLQEAGGLMWHDASGINYGRNDDANKPQYNYLREVDYCSGASICIPLPLWQQMHGFDPLYSPAYYEDTDLAFRIRDAGYKVLYQPASPVIHLEGVTSGTDVNQGVKHYQVVNREKFYQRWKDVLKNHGDSTASEFAYRNRARVQNALVIDVCTPKPDTDSGSIDTYYYLLTLRKLGFEVTFISVVDSRIVDHYVIDLQRQGIQCIYDPYLGSIDEYLKTNGQYYDLVFLFRAPFGGKYIDKVRHYAPKAKIVFNTVDLHFLREQREKEVNKENSSRIIQEGVSKSEELAIIRKSDRSILVSEYEQLLLNKLVPNNNSRVIPLPREIPGVAAGFEERQDIVFIGGFLHKPNVDAVLYFIHEIWPLISPKIPQTKFLIVGSNVPDALQQVESDTVRVVGFVKDLADVFNHCRISVAPLRYGAGIKGKILTSLSYGVPCVATSIATEGMGLSNQEILIGDSPQEFAQNVLNIYQNADLWQQQSQSGLYFVSNRFSLSNFENKLSALITELQISIGKDR